MAERHLGVRATARLVPCNAGHISNLRSDQKRPSLEIARRLDVVLASGGKLLMLAEHDRAQYSMKQKKIGHLALRQPVTADELWVDTGTLVMIAAHESSDRAANDAGKLVSDASIGYLQAEVIRLARTFGSVSPLEFLVDCRRSRDLGFQLLERTNRPAQSTDLYVVIGQLCALMAEASFDLAIWPAVIEQAHAASLYGEMTGHRSLQAWALGMQAITAYWRGQFAEAVKLAQAGVALAPPGSPRTRLLSISARAWAHAGNKERARTALALADHDRHGIGESGSDDLHDVIGGQFAWGPARHAMSGASALLTIGDAPDAARRSREAIRLQPRDQAGERVSALARADLACAELARGQADAAEVVLEPIWELEPAQRRFGLVERLGNISDTLGQPRFAQSQPIAGLIERIAVFTADATPKALPTGGVTGFATQ